MLTSHLTDEEITRIFAISDGLTPLERDLLGRLQRALDKIDDLLAAQEENRDDAGR